MALNPNCARLFDQTSIKYHRASTDSTRNFELQFSEDSIRDRTYSYRSLRVTSSHHHQLSTRGPALAHRTIQHIIS